MRLLFLPALYMMMQIPVSGCNPAVPKIEWNKPLKLPATGNQPSPGLAGPIAGFQKDFLIIGAGANFPNGFPWEGGKKNYATQLFLYQLNAKQEPVLLNTISFPDANSYGVSFSTPEGIVVAGGESASGISKAVWKLSTDGTGIQINSLPDLPIPLTNACGTAIGSQLYLAGGESITGMNNRFFTLSTATPSQGWQELPSVPLAVSHAVLVPRMNSEKQELLLIGGRAKNDSDTSELFSYCWAYSPDQQIWNKSGELPVALSAASGIQLTDGSIVLMGGDDGSTFTRVEKLLGAIARETDSTHKQNLIQQKNNLLSSHPGFRKEVLLLAPDSKEWSSIGELPFEPPVTTTLLKRNNQLVLPSGEIRAGVRSPFLQTGQVHIK